MNSENEAHKTWMSYWQCVIDRAAHFLVLVYKFGPFVCKLIDDSHFCPSEGLLDMHSVLCSCLKSLTLQM